MTMSQPAHHPAPIDYRSDIDGLRALAITWVVLYHFFPQFLPGGFIGVDIFFVISGFLITRIIATQVSKNQFSLSDFYAHRAKRIFPALITVLIAVYGIGWVFLHDTEFRGLSKHIFASTLFLNNFLLKNEKGYFDSASESKPLLHFWSLSIEEQFYLLWPLILWGALKWLKNPKAILLLIGWISFVANVYLIQRDAVATFYLPVTRIWELIAGGWIALTPQPKPLSKWLALVPGVGLLCLVWMGFAFDAAMMYPGVWALGVVMTTVWVMRYHSPWGSLILGHKAMVWLGRLSYPLYLWHWPLLSFATIVLPLGTPISVKILLLILALILAWLTKAWIEDPIRFRILPRRSVPTLFIAMLAIAVVAVMTYSHHGIPSRSIHKRNIGLGTGHASLEKQAYAPCPKLGISNECKMEGGKPLGYVLMGDSKAAALLPGLVKTNTSDSAWLFIGGNAKDGAPIPIISNEPGLQKFSSNFRSTLKEIDALPNVQWLVMAVSTRGLFQLSRDDSLDELINYKSYDEVLARFSEGIGEALRLNKRLLLVIDNPTFPAPEKCASRDLGIEWMDEYAKTHRPSCVMTLDTYNTQTALYKQLIKDTLNKHKGHEIVVYDTTADLCDFEQEGLCKMHREGHFLYGMTDHISEHAAQLIGKKINHLVHGSQ